MSKEKAKCNTWGVKQREANDCQIPEWGVTSYWLVNLALNLGLHSHKISQGVDIIVVPILFS